MGHYQSHAPARCMRKAVEVIKNTVEVLIMTNEQEFMVSQDQYLKSGIHIGTIFKT